MPTTRRDFLRTGTVLGGALGAGLGSQLIPDLAAAAPSAPAPARRPVERAAKPLRMLILGGTGFIGPHQVEYAQARGHTVTLFNRGRTNPGLFPNVEKLQGDRAAGDYKSLAGREFDVVIDNPTMYPRWVREAGTALKGRAKQFVFVSTLSVYAANDTPWADETAAVAKTDTPTDEDPQKRGQLYGPLKALSEQEAEKAFPGKATIIRPGLIVGPGDLTDRFTYWPVRVRKGGEILAPGTPLDTVQVIDARDLSEFIIRCAEDGVVGTYNATGPRSPLTMGEMLGAMRALVPNSDAQFVWGDVDFLAEQKVRGWSDMPVWLPPRGATAGFTRRSVRKALDKGLTFRPLADTIRDTLAFYDQQTEERKAQLRAGIAAAREQEVLTALKAKQKA
ncbi:NAD-dependent epimerase/dehydratase family protein [Roseisolibacter sp. H3M3-2]|uniref:NAD-dependent epimerase/dehydratase family protein n=1 Tax=Roseisolibacter sp. H3M3-2 TaxID=3031323 RepID=UPI0023DC880E|nr:NAD-dependent epimerase/dehydratase family protein [Roseisolibacter sp. H3M3-2]MDF1505759.1 SDR family oxidoreductase [Roseisolibacter sp. H3M3-2]